MGSESSSCGIKCPTVHCPEPNIPHFECPKLECPNLELPDVKCGDVITGAQHCGTINFPELKCISIKCPEITWPKFECPTLNCTSMTLECPKCLDYSIGLVIMVTILISLSLILTFIYMMRTRHMPSKEDPMVTIKVSQWRRSLNQWTKNGSPIVK